MQEWNGTGAAHHCAIGLGHMHAKLEKLAHLLSIECVRIC
jgi:L-arabinose isomerase